MNGSELAGGRDILRARGRVWPWALTVLLLTVFLLWAGSAGDPRSEAMWAFGAPGLGAISGASAAWLLPAPGIVYFLFAAFFLCGALGRLAFAGMACSGMSTRGKIFSAAAIFLGALAARLAALAWWHPWSLSPESLAARQFGATEMSWRWLGVVADMVTILLLLSVQLRKRPEEGRSLWVAGVYAFHPVVLLGVVDGSRCLLVMPVVVLAARFAAGFRRCVRMALGVGAAAGCAILLMRMPVAEVRHPFNGLLPLMLGQLGFDAGQAKSLLVGIGVALEGMVVVLALGRRWPVARAWVHMVVIAAIVWPRVMPLSLLPVVALLPIAWSYSGGLLTAVSLASFGIVLSWSRGEPFALPDWLIYVTMMPVVVPEIEAQLREAMGLLRGRLAEKAAAIPAAAA
jgi:hypothetical protein